MFHTAKGYCIVIEVILQLVVSIIGPPPSPPGKPVASAIGCFVSFTHSRPDGNPLLLWHLYKYVAALCFMTEIKTSRQTTKAMYNPLSAQCMSMWCPSNVHMDMVIPSSCVAEEDPRRTIVGKKIQKCPSPILIHLGGVPWVPCPPCPYGGSTLFHTCSLRLCLME